jgi:hypothetical protein
VKGALASRAGRQGPLVLSVACVLAAVLMLHFTATFLYVTPRNPVRLRFEHWLHAYMSPFFVQGWQMFAPGPFFEDRRLLVRARVRDGSGHSHVTEFHDVNAREESKSRLWRSHGFYFPEETITLLAGNDPRVAVRDIIRTERLPAPATVADIRARKQAAEFARALASAAAVRQWGDGVEAVQLRMVARTLPRWDQRDRERPSHESYDLWWMPRMEVSR